MWWILREMRMGPKFEKQVKFILETRGKHTHSLEKCLVSNIILPSAYGKSRRPFEYAFWINLGRELLKPFLAVFCIKDSYSSISCWISRVIFTTARWDNFISPIMWVGRGLRHKCNVCLWLYNKFTAYTFELDVSQFMFNLYFIKNILVFKTYILRSQDAFHNLYV